MTNLAATEGAGSKVSENLEVYTENFNFHAETTLVNADLESIIHGVKEQLEAQFIKFNAKIH